MTDPRKKLLEIDTGSEVPVSFGAFMERTQRMKIRELELENEELQRKLKAISEESFAEYRKRLKAEDRFRELEQRLDDSR